MLIDHYREQYLAYGHDPAKAYVGSGSGGLFLADTTEQAIEEFRPIYEGAVAQADKRKHDPKAVGKSTSFRTIEEAVDRGPALVGSSERVARRSSIITRATATISNRCRSITCSTSSSRRTPCADLRKKLSRW